MRIRTRSVVPAILLASALTISLSACGPEEDSNGSGKPASSASKSQGGDSKDNGEGGSSSGSGKGSSSGSDTGGEGGNSDFDNSKSTSLPLPIGYGTPSSAFTEEEILHLEFEITGPLEEAEEEYNKTLQEKGYEAHENGTFSRGQQELTYGTESGAFRMTVAYPDAAPPLPSDELLTGISNPSDDTLVLTYDLPEDDGDYATFKEYMGELKADGYEVPLEGDRPVATKGDMKVQVEMPDDKSLQVIVPLPSSVS
ncbi:hypothetical protein [Streptomyces sp. NPDC048639]|uniref:hypothetical protein n=1 Tax=Streptomyces sp. NPDC048639 TaxID=3365581 RepID=UPI00371FA8C5